MGIDTYFYVGPYVEVPCVNQVKIVKGLQCTGNSKHKIHDKHSRFCSVCGSAVQEAIISEKSQKTFLNIYSLLEELSSEEEKELRQKMQLGNEDWSDFFGYGHDTSRQVFWYIYDERLHYKDIDAKEGMDFVIHEDSVKNSLALFKELFAPLQSIIEQKYNIELKIQYGVCPHYS
jgi:hypothetical protein